MNVHFREIRKSDIPEIINEESLWDHSFLIATKHRLLAHYNNPKASSDDLVLLIGYLDSEIIGYMGIMMDHIHIGSEIQKIGWLSTWWLHPNAAGKGIGSAMLKKMYALNNGKIGVSQFTPSAKRVYDKSDNFYYLKKLEGCKVDIKLNLGYLLPEYHKSFKKFAFVFKTFDAIFNSINELKLKLVYIHYKKALNGLSIDYLSCIDKKTERFLKRKQNRNLTRRDADFFQFIKTYQWIEESPLLEFVKNEKKYAFSGYSKDFNIYLIKIENEKSEIIGFISLLKKEHELKVLQVFYEKEEHLLMTKTIIMHGIAINARTIITYDQNITNELKRLKMARIRFKKKERASMISKIYGEVNYEKYDFQYGDGDCSFA